ncbi:MAG: DUF262 domain-containing protein [Gemmatimonadetes bacterium]|nr:DUF262 domain-containing protein [Gemmatimonadota bacterium]
MAKSEATIEELVGMIERGELRLPEMQRRYVWRSTRVRDLLDSLYRGYPSGAILLWESDEDVPLQEFAIEQKGNPYQTTRLLLDGQQRLTSLSAVIRGKPLKVRGRVKPIEILFNLKHPEEMTVVTEVNENDSNDEDGIDDETDSTEDELLERLNRMTFVVGTRKLEQLKHWVRVTDVFKNDSDTQLLKNAGIENFDDPRYEKYSQRLAKLRNVSKYVYRMDILERSLSYEEVTEIFVRVNSLGAKLRSSDLALAQITAKWRGALKIFQDFQEQCTKSGFHLDLGIHLRNLVVFATDQSRFLTVGSLPLEKLKSAWKESVEGLNFTLDFLKNNVTIDSPALLSSPFLVVTLGYYFHSRKYVLTENEANRLRQWVLVANSKGRYSRGSSETLLDQDLATIQRGGGPDELLNRLRLQVGRLEIVPEELAGRNQRSALFKTMFLAFKAAGAHDWRSNLVIALGHRGPQHRLQFHHIFPKAVLKGETSAKETDDIANLAFIGGKTNRQISNKAPDQYFPDLISKAGHGPFEAQCIPTDISLLSVDSYQQFLNERRKVICKRLNEFIGHLD